MQHLLFRRSICLTAHLLCTLRRGKCRDLTASLARQNLCVEAELKGLGICYLGTTIYTAGEIADILELPKGVIPLTTVVVGYPDESPGLTDRLPLEAWCTMRNIPTIRPPKSTSCGPSVKSRSSPNASSRRTTCPTWRRSHAAPLRPQGQPRDFELLFRAPEGKGFFNN